MGVPIDPGPEYSSAIPECFDSGKTPETVIACFSGIEVSPYISPPPPPPPNGMWVLPRSAGNKYYQAWHGDWLIYWEPLYNGDTRIGATWTGSLLGFIAYPVGNCVTYAASELTDPYSSTYINGSCVIVCAKTAPMSMSMKEVGSLLNVIDDEHTKFDVWPKSASETIVRFARYKKQMNVLIRLQSP